MTALRKAAGILLALAALELLFVIVSGAAVAPVGFLSRLIVLAILLSLRFSGARLLLLLLILPTLFQFQFAGGRLGGDGVMYYVYVRSMLKDADVDFANEYAHYGLAERGDLQMPTSTGLRRSIFSIGPGLLAIPWFGAGELVARAQSLGGGAPDLSGYGPAHRNAVALGGLVYGFAAVLLIHDLLLRHFSASTALLAALAIWGTTFLHWYMVQQPVMSHAPSAFAAALTLWLWDSWRGSLGPGRALALGVVLGLAMCVRWQNGVLLLLPGLDLLRLFRRQAQPAALAALALGLGTLAGALPQLLAWKALYGEYLLRYPPHGADFLRLTHPFLLETFFSSRHGLLAWTPALWAGYLGFIPLYTRRRSLALALAVPLLLMSYVNACSGDWWAGGSFSNRRFDSLLPIFAFGFAAAIDVARDLVATRAHAGLALCAVPFVAWNLGLAEAMQLGIVPRDDTVAWQRLSGSAAQAVSEAVGFPTTWPASWIFARKQGLSPGRFDLLSGRYLFYRQNNLGGVIDLANPDHMSLLASGFGRIEQWDAGSGRRMADVARLLAPLDVPEPLELRPRVRALESPARVRLSVNGAEIGRFEIAPGEWQELRAPAPAALWHRELNDVVFETDGGPLALGALRFVRVAQP